MFALPLLLLPFFFLAGCKRPSSDSAATTPAAGEVGKAELTASPNPVPSGDGLGKTMITWNAGTDAAAAVSVDGAQEQVFAKGGLVPPKRRGFKPDPPSSSAFTTRGDHKTPLARLTVTRK